MPAAPMSLEELVLLLGRLGSMPPLERARALRGADRTAQRAVAAAYRKAIVDAVSEGVDVIVTVDGVATVVRRRRTHAEVASALGVTEHAIVWAVGRHNRETRSPVG